MEDKILVTGSTGNIGFYVVENLLKQGEKVKAAVHNIEKAKNTFKDMEVEIVPFDFLNTSTFEEALKDVNRIFLVRPPQLAKPKKDMAPFLEAIKDNTNIKQILFVSLMGVENNRFVPHRKIEDMIKDFDLNYTFLRPGFFMQNLSTTHKDDIKVRNELFVPVGKAKTSFIDTRDIGAVAATCLSEDGHIGKAYPLTGNEALDYYEIADIMSNVLDRKIMYKNPGPLEFRKSVIRRGTEKGFANVMTMLYLVTRFGKADQITNDVEEILGRPPINFKQFVEDYKLVWKNN